MKGTLLYGPGAMNVALTPEDVHAIDGASAHIEIHGARYLAAHKRLAGR